MILLEAKQALSGEPKVGGHSFSFKDLPGLYDECPEFLQAFTSTLATRQCPFAVTTR